MRFTAIAVSAVATLLSVAQANTIEFVNQDATDRTLVFASNPGMEEIPNTLVPGNTNKTVTFTTGWTGNWYSVSKGQPMVPGMLGEIAWDAWGGNHYFDVSAIVNPKDIDGVKIMYPKIAKTPLSGCQTFPCKNAYNHPDDIQTMSTAEKELVCLIGNLAVVPTAPVTRRHARDFVPSDFDTRDVVPCA